MQSALRHPRPTAANAVATLSVSTNSANTSVEISQATSTTTTETDEVICTVEPGFRCEECSKCFKSRQGLQWHLSLVHGKGNVFECTDHDYTRKHCQSARQLRQHCQRTHERTKHDTLFLSEQNDKRHLVAQHPETMYTNEEPGCETVFNHRDATHENVSYDKDSDCDGGFTFSGDAERRMVGCEKEKFVCCDCKEKFLDDEELVAHQRLCAQQIERSKKRVVCDKCSESFKWKVVLALHKLTDHSPRHQWVDPVVCYTCDQCNKSFESKMHVAVHKLIVHNLDQQWKPQQQGQLFNKEKHLWNKFSSSGTPPEGQAQIHQQNSESSETCMKEEKCDDDEYEQMKPPMPCPRSRKRVHHTSILYRSRPSKARHIDSIALMLANRAAH